MKAGMQVNGEIHTDDTEPVVVMVPGLTSDSDAAVSFLVLAFFSSHLKNLFR